MATILFKRLFEVRLLHDYYLTAEDGDSYFEKTATEQKTFIERKLRFNQYDIRKDIWIEPTADARRKMQRNRLRFARTAVGFIVGGEVKILEQPDGSILYEPRFDLDADLSLNFAIHATNSLWRTITQTRIRPDNSGKYYWTNADAAPLIIGTDTFLPLSLPVNNFEIGRVYQMGEPAIIGPNLSEALERNSDATILTNWRNKPESRTIQEGDRRLFARQMSYQFDVTAGITEATFILKALNNDVVKTIVNTDLEGGKRANLNFRKIDETDPNSLDIEEGFYQLQIQADNGLDTTIPIRLSDEFHREVGLGLMDIQLGDATTDYGLLDANGHLKTRIAANGTKTLHPIFELRMDSRITYWRYNREAAFVLADALSTNGHLVLANNQLVAGQPRRLTHVYTPFLSPTLLLPKPKLSAISPATDGKIYSDIWISNSNVLLV